MTSNKNDNLNINSPIQSESYLSILQRENATLVKNLQEQTEIANNLKGQVEEKEKEKTVLLKSIESQDNKIKENNKILSELKNQINELKEQIKKKQEEKNNNIIKLNNEKEDLIKDNENQGKNIDELKGKISNLENEIKMKRESKSTIEGQEEKKIEDNTFNKEKEEINEYRNKNNLLQKELDNIISEYNKVLNEKNDIIMKINESKNQKEKIQLEINQKEENILNKNNELKKLNEELNQQKLNQNELNSKINLMKNKYKKMEENNKELENVIIKQEEKVQELSLKIKKIVNNIQEKNTELNKNKSYITKLENTIKDLNKQFRLLRIQKPKQSQNEMNYLKSQIAELRRELDKDKSIIRNRSVGSINSYDRSFIQNRYNYNYQNSSFSKNNSYNIRKYYKVPQPKTRSVSLPKMYNQSIPRKNIRNNIKNDYIQKINSKINIIAKNVPNDKIDKIDNSDNQDIKLYYRPNNIVVQNNYKPISIINNEEVKLNEIKEKEKIDEIKNLMDQLVNDMNN